MDVPWVLDPIALEGAEVVPVTQFSEQILENFPVSVPAGGAELALQMDPDVPLDVVIVEERVVDVDQEDDPVLRVHDQTDLVSCSHGTNVPRQASSGALITAKPALALRSSCSLP